MSKLALVAGAGGFIGSHLVRRLKSEGFLVRGADLKHPEFGPSVADEFLLTDLREPSAAAAAVRGVDEVYQLAAEMGGAGYIFTGDHDAAIVHNSATINLNVLEQGRLAGVPRYFFSSSACIYPEYNQLDPLHPNCREDSAYPAAPDSEYGWEKLFSERLYLSYARNYGASPGSTTSSAPKARGEAAARRRLRRCAGRSRKRPMAARSTCGATATRRGPSSTSTSASRASAG